MSKWDKLLQRMCSLSSDMRFSELQKVLENHGYVMTSSNRGSHCTFRKAGKNPITVPRNEPIKKVYVAMLRKIVEEEALHEDN